jgi:hypothetical protein
MFGARSGSKRFSIPRTLAGVLVFLAAWHDAGSARGQGPTAVPSGQGITASAPATSATTKVIPFTNQPTNPCSGYSVSSQTQSVTIWYQTYFNSYTQCIQIVPAFTPNPGPPAGGARAATGSSTTTITGGTGGTGVIRGATTTITGANVTIAGVNASVTGPNASITVGGIPVASGTAKIANGTATVANVTVTITGGAVNISGFITTITGGAANITGVSASIAGDVTVTGGTAPNAISSTTITGATTTITGGAVNIPVGTMTITGDQPSATANVGAITITNANATITGGTASITGGTAAIDRGTGIVSAGANAGGAASTAGGQNLPPTQDVSKDPNQPQATAQPDSVTIQWDGSGSCPLAESIDVEIRICYRGRQGIYKTASPVTRSGTSFKVSLKEFGNSVMKQILLTDCYDLCGPTYLDCPVEVYVYPHCWTPQTDPAHPTGPPTWTLDKSTVPVPVMNTLSITIMPMPFSGPL